MRKIRKLVERWSDFVRRRRNRALAHPRKVVWVSPDAIHFKLTKEAALGLRGKLNVQPGDWDLERFPIEGTAKFKSVVQRFQDGMDWQETDLFQRYAQRLQKNGNVRLRHSMEELVDWYRAGIDRIYAEMRESGFTLRRRVSVLGLIEIKRKNRLAHVYIGRDGEFIFGVEGNHRFAMAKLLKLERIPCKVVCRHAEWQKIRERLFVRDLAARKADAGAALAEHPDLQDLLNPSSVILH